MSQRIIAMHSSVKMLREFQNSLSLKLEEGGLSGPSSLHQTGSFMPYAGGDESWDLCLDLLEEEYKEFLDAVSDVESLIDVASGKYGGDGEFPIDGNMLQEEKDKRAAQLMKEMCDLLYVVLGMSVRYKELTFLPEAFGSVHANNMLKLNGGTLDASGKLQKPPDYSPVDLTDLVIRGRGM
jgi:predicted HAD superfamily Cof-like phosphohydrolase